MACHKEYIFTLCILSFSLFRWRPGCTERALPASRTHVTHSAPSRTNVSSCIIMHQPDAKIPTLPKFLLSASSQTCTSPMLLFKKRLQIMTLNRSVLHKSTSVLLCLKRAQTPVSSLFLQRYASGRCSSSDDTSLPSMAGRGSGDCLKTSITYLCAASKVSRRSS